MDSIEGIIKKATINKSITMDEILELKLNENEFNKILELLNSRNIYIYENDSEESLIKDDSYEESDSYKLYLKDISKYPLLTPEEEIEVCYRILNGDKKAYEKLINSNLRLVVNIAKCFASNNLTQLDLIQEGNVGLQIAARKFDVRKGYKFSTYANWWIRQSIGRAISQSDLIRLPVNIFEKQGRIKKYISKYEEYNKKKPTIEEISKGVLVSEKTVKDIVRINKPIVSLDAPAFEDNLDLDGTIGDFVADDYSLQLDAELSILFKEVDKEIRKILKPKYLEVLYLRLGIGTQEPMRLEDVGKQFGITKERVRQMEATSLEILRNYFLSKRQLDNGDSKLYTK